MLMQTKYFSSVRVRLGLFVKYAHCKYLKLKVKLFLFTTQIMIVFGISTSNNLGISKICA